MKTQLIVGVVGVALVAAVSIGVTAQRGEPTDPAQRNDKVQAAQALATRVGQILGAATACHDIARPRITGMNDMLMEVFRASTSNADELTAIRQLYDKSVTDGQNAVSARRVDCGAADRNLANLEKAVTGTPTSAVTAAPAPTPAPAPPPPRVIAPPPSPADAAPPRATVVAIPPVPSASAIGPLLQGNLNVPSRGISDNEIRFGLSAPFSGPAKELGHQMKLGIETAFSLANERGVNGRQLRLVTVDDGYEPTRTTDTMKQL